MGTVASRRDSNGRPYCANKLVLAGHNDLGTAHPDLAAQADGWEPSIVIARTNRKLARRCPKAHSWSATVSNWAIDKRAVRCARAGWYCPESTT